MIRCAKTEICLAVLAAATCWLRAGANESGSAKPSAARFAVTAANQYTVAVPPGYSALANHLNQGGNTVAELLPNPPEGTLLYKFDADRQIHTVNQFQFGAWVRPNETLAPGEGALIRNSGNEFPVAFSGTKPASAAVPELKGGFNLISLPVPGESTLPAPKPGDQIVRLDAVLRNFRTHTFDELDNDWSPPLGALSVGEAFYYRPGNLAVGPGAVAGGTVYFSTHISPALDARITFVDGVGLGEGWTAQLHGGPAGTPISSLAPLEPPTSFQTTSATVRGYVHPVVVAIPGVPAGVPATVVMRVFNGKTFETSTAFGELSPITIAVGGGIVPPGDLAGLMGLSFMGHLPPQITRGPADITVGLGGQATFTVSVTSSAPLFYQWLKDGVDLPGQTSATLTLNKVQMSDAGSYAVRVASSARPVSVMSSPAVLSLLSIDVYPGLTIVGPVGARYRIEYALEANAASWAPLTEVILLTSPSTFSDFTASARTKRFYRAVLLP